MDRFTQRIYAVNIIPIMFDVNVSQVDMSTVGYFEVIIPQKAKFLTLLKVIAPLSSRIRFRLMLTGRPLVDRFQNGWGNAPFRVP